VGIAINVMLFVTAFFCLAVGITAITLLRLPSWLAGQVTRPRLWGAGYALFGLTVLYHAVAELVRLDPASAVYAVMTDVTPLTAIVGFGMMYFAQRAGRGRQRPHSESGSIE
jgi:hypothetical protein